MHGTRSRRPGRARALRDAVHSLANPALEVLEPMRKTLLPWLLPLATGACRAPAPAPLHPIAPPAEQVATAKVASADGVPIAYSVRGSGSPALVFVHGWLCDQEEWAEQAETFAVRYRVVTLDLAGHGASGGGRLEWTLEAFGADVQAVVDALDLDRVILIGHSMGGPVALEAARRLPGRVVGVIAVDALHDADHRADPAQTEKYLATYEKDFRGTCDGFVRSLFLDDTPPDLVGRVARKMCAGSPEMAIPLLRQLFGYDLGAAMAAAGVPIRSINSDHFPTNVEGNRKHAPDYDAVIMPHVGHFIMLERPKELDRLLAEVIAGLTGETAPAAKTAAETRSGS